MVVPLSTSAVPRPPIAVAVECFNQSVVAICDQIRIVDKSRLSKLAGKLRPEDLDALDEGLRQVLSL